MSQGHGTEEASHVALGGRLEGCHAGEAAQEVGGLGMDVLLAAGTGVLAQQEEFAEEVYAALCNTEWVDRHGRRWSCTWRCAADVAAILRGWPGDSYASFHCGGGEGSVSARVREEFLRLGWAQDDKGAPGPPADALAAKHGKGTRR